MIFFIYNEIDDFPYEYKDEKIDFSEIISGLIYFSKIDLFKCNQNKLKYLGIYKNDILLKSLAINYENIMDTIDIITDIVNNSFKKEE